MKDIFLKKKIVSKVAALLMVCVVFGVFAVSAVPTQVAANPVTSGGGLNPGLTAASFIGGKLAGMVSDEAKMSVASWTVNTVMAVVAISLRFAGTILDISLDYSLNLQKVLDQVPIVDIGWKVLRDIANIVFIFIALWSGISIILGTKTEKAWGLLAQIVLVALFINFSLFITKAVVDASNIAALHFYRLMVANPGGDQLPQQGLSSAFMQGLRLETLYDSRNLGKDTAGQYSQAILARGGKDLINPWNILLIGIFGSIFMLIAAFVFFSAAVLFVIRTITLLMLMILSPLAFVAWLLPGAGGLASKWWSTLWSQSFFAPLYMALAYVVVATIQQPAFKAYLHDASFAAAITADGSAPSSVLILFNFILMSALLIGCLVVANSLGARGSGVMMKLGGKIATFGMGAIKAGTIGTAGSLAAKGIGAMGKGVSDSLEGTTNPFGRATQRIAKGMQDFKFGGGKSYKEQKEQGTFFRVGEKEIEENLKKMKSRPADQARYVAGLSGDDREHAYEHLSARDRVAVEQEGRRTGVLTDDAILGRDRTGRTEGLRSHLTAEEREKTEKAQRESTKDAATETRRTELEQFETEIRAAGATGLTGMRLHDLERLLERTSEKEITGLEGALITALAPYLRSSQMNAVQTNNELGQNTKDDVRTARYRAFDAAVTAGNATAVKTAMGNWNRQERAGLAPTLLQQEVVIRNLDPKDLKEIVEKRGIDPATLTTIKSTIQRWGTAAGVAGAAPLPPDQRRLVDYFNSTAGQELFA